MPGMSAVARAEDEARARRTEIKGLEDEFTRNRTRIAQLELRQEEIRAQLADLAGLEPPSEEPPGIGEQTMPDSPVGVVQSPEVTPSALAGAQAARAAARLGAFTLPELAAAAEVPLASLGTWAKQERARGRLVEAGKFHRTVMYEWQTDDDDVEAEVEAESNGGVAVAAEVAELPEAEAEPPWTPPAHAQAMTAIREWVQRQQGEFGVRDAVGELGLDEMEVQQGFALLEAAGAIRNIGLAGLVLFERVTHRERGTDHHRSGPQARGQVVAGTGRKLGVTNAEVRALVEACIAAGAEVEHAQQGHFAVSYNGRRCLIAATPGGSRTVLNDRARVRRMGVPLAR